MVKPARSTVAPLSTASTMADRVEAVVASPSLLVIAAARAASASANWANSWGAVKAMAARSVNSGVVVFSAESGSAGAPAGSDRGDLVGGRQQGGLEAGPVDRFRSGVRGGPERDRERDDEQVDRRRAGEVGPPDVQVRADLMAIEARPPACRTEPRADLGERLVLAQACQGEKCLLPRVEQSPSRPDRLAPAADQPGDVVHSGPTCACSP